MALFQTDNLWVALQEGGVAVLYLDMAGRSVNLLTQQVLGELEEALARVEAEPSVTMLQVRSGKKGHFIAGADVNEFTQIRTPEEAWALSERGQKLFARLAALRVPVVAVIGGACLGGGLELALACSHRAVVDDVRVQLGLPEVELGLIPAWGGTQRLPRAVGLERGLQMILSGRRLRAREAVKWGLADLLLPSAAGNLPPLPDGPVRHGGTGLPIRNWRDRFIDGTGVGRSLIFKTTEKILRERVPEGMPAPWEALEAVRAGINEGMDAGLAREREAAARLVESPASRNLIHLFLLREKARKVAEISAASEPPVRRVGIVGAGTMGAGIAQLAALRGCDVVVQEADETALGVGMIRIVGLFEQAAKRGIIASGDLLKKLSAIHGSTSWKGFADVDLVIEAVTEDLDTKKRVFREIEGHVSPSTIIATNTSSLRVQHLQEGLKHQERVAGLHFFNPVHKMPLIEVVRSPATKPAVADNLLRFATALGKTPVLVQDSPGFLVNRVLMPYLNESVLLVSEGIEIAQVDLMMRWFGMPVGPLELLDQIGLDVAAKVAEGIGSRQRRAAYETKLKSGDFGYTRLTPHPGFALMASKGWLGEKTDRGFYVGSGRRKKPNHLAENALRQQAEELGIPPFRGATDPQALGGALDRMVLLMVNESARCLEENIVADADTLNLALVLGAGWAPHRGGPLKYAEDRGYREVVETLERLQEQWGERFAPCGKLRALARR